MKDLQPIGWITYLMERICKSDLWESVHGDLLELFQEDFKTRGKWKANWRYLINALAFLRYPRILEIKSSKTQINMHLISNYLKVTYRDLSRHKSFAFIVLFGLVTGFASCLYLFQYVLFETSFDRFNDDYDRIYRVYNDRYQEGELVQHGTITYPMVGPSLVADYPEVTDYTRMTVGSRIILSMEDQLYILDEAIFADEFFLNFFDYPLIQGNIDQALDETGDVVVTEAYAKRLLDSNQDIKELMGKSIKINNSDVPCVISAILKDPPEASHLKFDALISYKTFIRMAGEGADNSRTWSDFYHYVKLSPEEDQTTLEAKLGEFSTTYFGEGEVSGSVEQFHLQPLSEARLYSDFEYEIGETAEGDTIWMLLTVAIVVLVIAWINYVNLASARALQRAREVGVRKVLGANRTQLVWQFLIESVLINTLALAISFLLVVMLQPWFNQLVSYDLDMQTFLLDHLYGIPFWMLFVGGFLTVILILSIYPALVLSGFRAEEVRANRYFLHGDSVPFRKVLVTFQYVTALVLIAGTLTIQRQIQYMESQPLGYNMDHTMVIYGPRMSRFDSAWIQRFETLKYELEQINGVEQASLTGRVFGDRMGKLFNIQSPKKPNADNISCNFIFVDHGYFSQFDIPVLAGRALDATDHNSKFELIRNMVITESASKLFGFEKPEDAINRQLGFQDREFTIVGVTGDIHQLGLQHEMSPIMFFPIYETNSYLTVKTSDQVNDDFVAQIEELFSSFFPGNHFDYFFLEDHFREGYRSEQQLAAVAGIFAFLSIVIAVLGLYGLILLTLLKRTKEIGLRKVLGATVVELILNVSRDYVWLVLAAIMLGLPISWWFMKQWTSGFAYNIGMDWMVLLGSVIVLIAIASITILVHVRRVSSNNPVESLKYE